MNYVIFSRGWQSHLGLPKDIIVCPSQPLGPKHSVPFFLPVVGGCSLYNVVLFIHCVQLHFVGTVF